MTPFVLAIDGGGTKTAAALFTAAGDELASARAGPANLYRDAAAGLGEIRRAWEELCRSAGLDAARAAPETVVSAGLAGVTGSAQRAAFAAALPAFAGRRLSSDGYTAFLGTFGTEPGALLAVGTGTVAYRRVGDAPPRLHAGWGFPVGDRGSGAWLGLRLVGEWLDSLDGAAAIGATAMWPEVAARLGPDREARLAWLRDAGAADFAALAPAVVAAAAAPLALAGGLASTYRPALAAALGEAALLAPQPPAPLRGAWVVATGAAPPEFPDVT